VSKTAAINESKLRLDYPTQLLQDQLSILDSKLALFIKALDELNAILSAHVHPDATNRHPAQAITVKAADAEGSAVASTSLGSGVLQAVLEEIYNAHINYTGEGISSDNNSHKAQQVYYDNEDTSDLIPSNNVQDAIDDLAGLEGTGIRNANLNFNSNGIIRTGSVYDSFEGSEVGSTLVVASAISYSGPDGSSREAIVFTDQPSFIVKPKPFDILTILDSPSIEDNREYLISSIKLTVDDKIEYVEVLNGPKNPVTAGLTAKITKSIYTTYNENSLNCVVRPRRLHSNTPDVQVALPNAATIISSGIRPSNLVSGSADTLSIEIDGGSAVEINVFNSTFSVQTIDTIVDKVNQHAVENALNIFAYKLRALRCFELAISHVLPNFNEDSKNRTIKIIESPANDASSALGLTYILDREVEGAAGNTCHINGLLIESFGQITKYTSTSVSIQTGTMNLESAPLVDFFVDGIREGDLCVIEGSSISDDDGTYRVNSVESDIITLDSIGSSLQGEISGTAAAFIIRCTAPVGEMEFDVDNDLILFDVFADENQDIHYQRRLSLVGHFESTDFYGVVSDVSSNFILDGESYNLTVDANGMASLKESTSIISGESIFVGATGVYKVFSADKMSYVTFNVFVPDSATFPLASPPMPITVTLSGNPEIPRSVLHLCRGIYSSEFGFILGTSSGSGGGIPQLIDKRTTGTTDDTIISESFLERYIQGPRNELRGSGVVRNAEVEIVTDNVDGTCTITVNPGIVVVNGIRFEYLGANQVLYRYGDDETDLHNFYVALDGYGCIIFGNEVDPAGGTDYISPFSDQTVAHLGYIEPDGVGPTSTITDLRLLVDHIDYKVLGDVIVSNDKRFGHFTDIQKAVDYARLFSKMFTDMGTPSIFLKEGTHEIDSHIFIDFDLTIRGAGPQTIVKNSSSYDLSMSNITHQFESSSMFLIGLDAKTDIEYGVTMENITLVGTAGQANDVGGIFINIRHNTNTLNSKSAIFTFDKLRFIAASDYNVSSTNDLSGGSGPNMMPFHIGVNNSGKYGNIIISNCYFKGVGYQRSVVRLNSDNEFNNISVINNISVESIDTVGGYTMINQGASTVRVNVQEIGNMIIPFTP
jgi:tRNA(Phe) wybutosine-synthesizing methylase Tyw3